MSRLARNLIVVGTFLGLALLGLALSFAAPYIKSGDELVYLTGALQAEEGSLPDAYMLQGMDFGAYLYPKVMHAWYEDLGYPAFKSAYLVVLMLATGLSAYAMFRLLWLSWVPALLLAVVALMPRFASGLEIFGVFTFRDAIGRASAYPLFFIGTGLLVRRIAARKATWPIFALFGLCLFLHPVTVLLFAVVALCATSVTRLFQRARLRGVIGELFVSGLAFIIAGSYFFIDVARRLSRGVSGEGVPAAEYVHALLLRNQFDFPAGSLAWYPHMAIVSALFLATTIGFYALPALRRIREAYPFCHERELLAWGGTVAVTALVLSPLLPGLNLYLMQHADAPYVFQQWSRIAKFYYLGLFVALVPSAYALGRWYVARAYRFRSIVIALLFLAGIGSSTLFFEGAQFAAGYAHFEKGYIPQALSGLPDDTRPEEYRETCAALERLGFVPGSAAVSSDFAFRYYCRADLYVTQEEGSAYQQLSRADLVDWYRRNLAQREALASRDPAEIAAFAERVDAEFVIVSRNAQNEPVAAAERAVVATTSRHIILKISR